MKQIEEEDDEALRMALEASLQLAKEESLKTQEEKQESHKILDQAHSLKESVDEELKEGPPLAS